MENLRILIVDDDVADLQVLPRTVALHMKNIHIDTSDSASGALQQLQEHTYDVIVSDIKMPGMDGITLIEKFQALSPETPTLLLTAYGDRDLAISALRGGAYDFIEKPIDCDYFVSSLQRAIQTRQMRCLIEEQQQALERQTHQLEQTVAERTQELVEANAALRQSRDAFRLLTEAMPQLVWIACPDGFLEYLNQQWYTYTGSTVEQALGEGWAKYYHPDDRERVLALWYASLLTNQPFDVEARLRQGATGAYRWFLLRATPLLDEYGRVWRWLGTSTDIHEKKCTEEALRESELRFRRFFRSNILGMIMFDVEGNILEANDAFLALLGYTQAELKAGRVKWTEITPPEYHRRDAQGIEELLATGATQPFEKEYIAKDGRRVPVLIGGAYLRQEGQTQLGECFVLDLTARKESERQKDLMLGLTSHELKTPLAALRGILQLTQRRLKRAVRMEPLPPGWRAFVQDLTKSLQDSVRQIDVQTHLINDLLDVSRITAHTLKLEQHRCDLVSIVRDTVENLRVIAPERSLLLDVPEHTAVHVLADRDRISQVMTNYVTNALRYSPSDQPVQIGLTIQEDAARVWVRDHGPGLTEEEQKYLWQRFSLIKGVAVQSGSDKGLGLGLYICRTLIEQHQGEVGVESTPGDGSTFWFTLPIVT